jgi:uncharacterized membrane protein
MNPMPLGLSFMNLSARRNLVRKGIGIVFIGAGLVHFTHASLFENLVPFALNDYRASINAATGALIFAMGVAFLVPRLRAVARWSAITLLAVTLPMTAYRAIHPAAIESLGFPPALATVGVVAWLLMIALIWWATKLETNDRKT